MNVRSGHDMENAMGFGLFDMPCIFSQIYTEKKYMRQCSALIHLSNLKFISLSMIMNFN